MSKSLLAFVLALGALLPVTLTSRTAVGAVFIVGDDVIQIPGYARAPKGQCSSAKRAEVFAAATAAAPSVSLDCSLSIGDAATTITKTINLEGEAGSNLILDCTGSVLAPTRSEDAVVIRSRSLGGGAYEPAHHVQVKNCEVRGRVPIVSFSTTEAIAQSRVGPSFTQWAQARAPHHVTLDTLNFDTNAHDPIYFHVGVTYSTLKNSYVGGTRASPVVYLDAESGHNLIWNNTFQSVQTSHQVLAIDGSAMNRIVGNRFAGGLDRGGVFIYRNCGERGQIRVQEPRDNQIINNSFYYNTFNGSVPGIFIGSRNRSSNEESFCKEDAGYSYGSSIDNHDFAYDTIVAQNRFFKFNPNAANPAIIRSNYPYTSTLNVGPVTSDALGASGCYVYTAMKAKIFFVSGESVGALVNSAEGYRYTCNDGFLKRSQLLSPTIVPFSCSASGNNSGCAKMVQCSGVKVWARAVCNLETPSFQSLSTTGWGWWKVAVPSDTASQGGCVLKTNGLTASASTGSVKIDHMMGWGSALQASCYEYDANGGDCSIIGEMMCL
jgi:hypothetical protein